MLLWDKFFFIPKRTSSFLFVADGSTEHKRYIWETWCTLECITLALLCFWVFIVQYSNQFVSRLWNPSDESVLLTVVSNQNMHDFSPGSKWMRLPIDRNYREKLKKKTFPFRLCLCVYSACFSYTHNFKHGMYCSCITESTESDDSIGPLYWAGQGENERRTY